MKTHLFTSKSTKIKNWESPYKLLSLRQKWLPETMFQWNGTTQTELKNILLFCQQWEMIIKWKKLTDPQDKIDEILLGTRETGILKFYCWVYLLWEKKWLDIVWQKFEEYRKLNQNFRVACLVLRNVNQKINSNTNEHKITDKFISRLHLQAALSDYQRMKQFIQMCKSNYKQKIKKNGLRESHTNCKKPWSISQRHETIIIHKKR